MRGRVISNCVLALCPLLLAPLWSNSMTDAAKIQFILTMLVIPVLAYLTNPLRWFPVAIVVNGIAVLCGFLMWGIETGNLQDPDPETPAVLWAEFYVGSAVVLLCFGLHLARNLVLKIRGHTN